jgi:PEP-CTERM motif
VFNPLGVTNNAVPMANNGQDANGPLSASVAATSGTSIFSGVNINVSAANTAGDYFLHFNDPAGSTNFYGRLFLRSSGTGFNVGLASNSGTGTVTTYGTSVLNFGQTYRVVTSWDFVAGAANDIFNVYIDPTNATQNLNTAEIINYTWTGSAEPAQVSAINLRQGTTASAPTLVLDDLTVGTVFSTVITPVPEPATMLGLAALGFGVAAYRRRR